MLFIMIFQIKYWIRFFKFLRMFLEIYQIYDGKYLHLKTSVHKNSYLHFMERKSKDSCCTVTLI